MWPNPHFIRPAKRVWLVVLLVVGVIGVIVPEHQASAFVLIRPKHQRSANVRSLAVTPSLDPGWNSMCPYTRSAKVDPIFSFGKPSMHQHDFFGTVVEKDSTYDSLLASSTVCGLAEETAGYWAPSFYKIDDQGNPYQIPPESTFIYWTGPPDSQGTLVHPMPPNLKMRAGDPMAPPNSQDLNVVWFDCSENGGPSPRASVPYLCPLGSFVRAHIRFPSCWDGTPPLPIGDDSSHVFYPVHEVCPKGTDRLPQIHMVILYPVRDGRNARLASGGGPTDPNSIYTLHADYFHAWQQDVFAALVGGCLNETEGEKACGLPHTPSIDYFSPLAALPGASVTVRGDNFGGTKAVAIAGAAVPFTVVSGQEMSFVAPAGVRSGVVSITSDGGTGVGLLTTGYSPEVFRVIDASPGGTASDDFDRVVVNGWGVADSGAQWKTTGGAASDYAVDGKDGLMTLPKANKARLAYLPLNWTDGQSQVRFKVDKLPATMRVNAYVVSRYSSVTGAFYAMRVSVLPDKTLMLAVTKKPLTGPEVQLGSELSLGKIGGAGLWFWIRAWVVNEGAGVRIEGKAWKYTTPEPADWQVSYLDKKAPLLSPGSPALRASPWASDTPFLVSFEDYTGDSFLLPAP